MYRWGWLSLAVWLWAGVMTFSAAAQETRIAIGAGSTSGTYYPVAEAICTLVNAGVEDHGIRCMAEVTTGSVFNLNQIGRGDVEIAIVQSDWQYHAVTGTSVFKGAGPNPALRALTSLFPESLTVIARRDAGIASFDDLKGKRVNLDQPGSGSRRTAVAVMTALGWQPAEFAAFNDLKLREALVAFCNRKVDAFVLTVAHPNVTVKEALDRCEGVLIPVAGGAIDGLVSDNVEYVGAAIPGDAYGMPEKTTPSFAVIATVVAMEALDDETAFQLVKAVGDNLDTLKRRLPVFRDLSLESMRQGNTAPLHPGAIRYFKEADAQ